VSDVIMFNNLHDFQRIGRSPVILALFKKIYFISLKKYDTVHR
jgi:hypothetical protein